MDVKVLAEDVTWQGVTTGCWWWYRDIERRLVIDHSLEFHTDSGVWQKDIEVTLV
jgi:hypothetical protein